MKEKANIILSILALTLLFACDPNGNQQTTGDNDQIDSTNLETLDESKSNIDLQNGSSGEVTSGSESAEESPQYYICYKADSNANLAISISFGSDEKALKVKYKGQKESMTLSYLKEDFQEDGAHPNIDTYYSEMYEGKENGVFKLTHSGIWDYAEYTRSKDGKKFNFTIDHELSIENDTYRTTPCF